MFQTDLRYGGVSWAGEGVGLLYESWYKSRTIRAWVVDTDGRTGLRAAAPFMIVITKTHITTQDRHCHEGCPTGHT